MFASPMPHSANPARTSTVEGASAASDHSRCGDDRRGAQKRHRANPVAHRIATEPHGRHAGREQGKGHSRHRNSRSAVRRQIERAPVQHGAFRNEGHQSHHPDQVDRPTLSPQSGPGSGDCRIAGHRSASKPGPTEDNHSKGNRRYHQRMTGRSRAPLCPARPEHHPQTRRYSRNHGSRTGSPALSPAPVRRHWRSSRRPSKQRLPPLPPSRWRVSRHPARAQQQAEPRCSKPQCPRTIARDPRRAINLPDRHIAAIAPIPIPRIRRPSTDSLMA